MIQTNITALTLLTRLFSADMVESKRGMILNVASLAAYTPGPLMAVYHATKSYVLAFSEAIAEEMRGSGVTVTALVPGITRTGFQVRAGIKEHKLGRAMEAADVAAQGYRAMLSGKTVHVAGTNNRVLGFLAHHAPHSIATRVAHRMQRQLLR
jgi:short-subunit dehydrogenase